MEKVMASEGGPTVQLGGPRPVVHGEDRLYAEFLRWLRTRGSNSCRERFAVPNGTGFQVIATTQVVWIQAADNYVQLHTPNSKHLLRSKLSDLQRELDPTDFVRIHRSAIIRVDAVRKIQPWGVGEYLFIMSNGEQVSSSRRYRAEIRAVFFGP